MIVVRFDSLKSITGSVYTAIEGYDQGWFLVDDISFGQGSQLRAGKSGEDGPSLDMFVEKAEKNELTITKPVDVFTPHLMFKAATDRKLKAKTGEFIDIAFLSVRGDEKELGARAWLKVTFGTCFLVEWKLSGSTSDSIRPTEDLTITYNQVAIGYQTPNKTNANAKAIQPVQKSIDLLKLGGQKTDSGVTWSDGESRVK